MQFHRHQIMLLLKTVLPSLAFTTEAPLRCAIEEYVAARPELERKELDKKFLEKIVETLFLDVQLMDRYLSLPTLGG